MTYQVSIFLENRRGHFRNVTTVLRENNISIRSMTITDTASGWGVLNLILDKPEVGAAILKEHNFSAVLREVLIFRTEDEVGALDTILEKLEDANINFTNASGRVIDETNSVYLVLDVTLEENIEIKLKSVGLQRLNAADTYKGSTF